MAEAQEDRRRAFPLGRVLLAVGAIALVVRTIDVLLVIFLAVILGVYLEAVADQLERRLEMPRAAGLALALVVTLGAAVGVVVLIAPAVSEQVRDFLANLPQYLSDLDRNLTGLLRRVPLLGRSVTEQGPAGLLASSLNDLLDFLRGAAVPYLRGGVEFLIEGISVLVMAIYLARTPGVYADGLVALVPPDRRSLARSILADLRTTLRAWVVGQIVAMVLLAALTTLGLWVLGIPYFLAFGVFAGVAAIVPFFGVLFSTLLPTLFALGALGLGKALGAAAVGVGVHLIEANFVAPLVMERQVNIPPVVTIAGVLLIGKLFGLAGLVIAVPILASIMVLIRHILLGEIYGDPLEQVTSGGTRPAAAEPTVTARPESP
ncbi:MAG TPA: AI-2E family transporter [Gemmatimonadales bacterium]|jgi:predicted PurR-regulated permease PerM|nr:AI-2E family transporter [Gemmatimonadales bacterium]